MANDYDFAPDFVGAAREFIRTEGDGCPVSIWQLLDELSDKFGDRLPVSSDTCDVLRLIETLWADPEIHQVPDGWIEFGWIGEGFDEGPGPEYVPMLRALIARTRKEDRSVPTVDVAAPCSSGEASNAELSVNQQTSPSAEAGLGDKSESLERRDHVEKCKKG